MNAISTLPGAGRPNAPALAGLVGLLLLVGAASPAGAQEADGVFAAADGLVTLDGEPFALEAVVQGHEATVLVWYATSCPCVSRYQSRVAALREAWPEDRVAIVAVASNADDDAGSVRAAVDEADYPVPVVRDPGGRLAEGLDVYSTPTTVLLDGEGTVRFRGWIDNERPTGDEDREPYLERALETLLGLRADGPDSSPVYGCPVTRSW